MDLHKACNILNIEVNDILDKKLKKAYHREALDITQIKFIFKQITIKL